MVAQRAAVERGDWINPADGQRVFAAVANEWRGTWVDHEPRTRHGYESILRQLNDRFGQARISALRSDAIQDFVNELSSKRATNTVRRHFTVLRSVMRVAVERNYVSSNPCDSVRLPKKPRGTLSEQLFLSPNEVRTLAEAIDPHFRVLVYLAAYTGLRAGELGALRRSRVDLLRGTIRVEEALKDVSGHLVWGEPKSEASRRTVSIPASVRDLLAEHLLTSTVGGTGPDSLVFTTKTGSPMRHGLFYRRVFKPAVREALPVEKHGLRFHDLRHTCASISLAVSPNLHMVKVRLGHEDIRTTINTYGHLVPSVDQALTDGLDALFETAADTSPNEEAKSRQAPESFAV